MSERQRNTEHGHDPKKERDRTSKEGSVREPEREGERASGSGQELGQEQNPKNTDELIDIKTIKSIEEVPENEASQKNSEKSFKKQAFRNNEYGDPDRENILNTDRTSRDSYAKRYVRLQVNKGPVTCIESVLIFLSYILLLICFPVSLFCVFVVVRQFERAVILRNGKVYKNRTFGPGLIHYLPCVDVIKFTDLRITCYAVPPQEALTKDSLTVSVDAVVYYKICDPIWATINVADYRMSTHFLAATTLRNALGTRKLSELLVDRPAVCYQVFQHMRRFAREWGIKIVRVEIKDICLPLQLQKAMAAEAESSRLANAKIIVAKAEIETTRNLQLATTMLMDNPLCMQLRYLQSLHMIASEKTHTIVFPFTVEAFRKIFNNTN